MKHLILLLLTGSILSSQATAQVKPFGILQGLVRKNRTDADVSFGGSLSGGLLLKERWGVGINVQAFPGRNSGKTYMPLNFEASYFTQKKFSPYFNIQIGKGIFSSTRTFSAPDFTSVDKTTGGYYFSPGAGILLPFIGKSKVIASLSYIRSQYRRQMSIVGDPTRSDERYIRDGYKVGLGFKL